MSADPSRRAHLNALALACTGAVLFSGKAVVTKLLYREGIDPVDLLALRMLLAAPIFLGVAIWTWPREPRLHAADLLRIAVLGFTGYYLSTMLDFMGLQYISVGLERLILFLTPSFVLLLGLLFWRRRVSRQQWLSLICAYLGVALVFWQDVHLGGDQVVLGSALVLAATVVYSLYMLMSGELIQRVGTLRLVSLAMLVSTVAALVQYIAFKPLAGLFSQTPTVWGLSLINSSACTVAPVFLTMMAVARVGAGTASQASMIGPVSTLFLGAWILAEPITLVQMAGTALVLLGVYLLSRVRTPRPLELEND